MSELIYGRNAVREALRANRRTIQRMLVAAGAQPAGTLADAIVLAKAHNIPIETVDRRVLEQRLHGLNHQGVALETGEYPYSDLDSMLALAKTRNEMPFLLLLDHL